MGFNYDKIEGVPDYKNLGRVYNKTIRRTKQLYNLVVHSMFNPDELATEIEEYVKIDNPLNDWSHVLNELHNFKFLKQDEFEKLFNLSKEYLNEDKYSAYEIIRLVLVYIQLIKLEIVKDFDSFAKLEEFIIPIYDRSIAKTTYDINEHPDDQSGTYLAETPTLKAKILEFHKSSKNIKNYDRLSDYLDAITSETRSLNNQIIVDILVSEDQKLLDKLYSLFITEPAFSVGFLDSLSFYIEKEHKSIIRSIILTIEKMKLHLETYKKENPNSVFNVHHELFSRQQSKLNEIIASG